MEYYLGQIMLWSADWAPEGWMICDGQTLNVREYQALFSIIDNKFGGDGRTSFGLPDLRGRVPLGFGQGPSLSNHPFASTGGGEVHSLTVAEMPGHTHTINEQAGKKPTATLHARQGTTTQATDPEGQMLGVDNVALAAIYAQPETGKNVKMSADAIELDAAGIYKNSDTGGSLAHNNMQPYLALNYIIAVSGGIYPPKPNKDIVLQDS